MKQFILCLDLGGSKIKVASSLDGLILSEPNFVAIDKTAKKSKIKYVGKEAKLCQENEEELVVISPINKSIIINNNEATQLIKNCLDKCDYNFLIPECLVAIPSGITNYEKEQTEKLLNKCGICKVNFVQQGIVVENYLHTPNNKARMLVDIGATATDISVVKDNKVVTGCTVCIGGSFMDEGIIDFCKKAFSIKISVLTAEKIRNQIASLQNNDNTRISFEGESVNGEKTASNYIYSKDLKLVLEPIYKDIVLAIETVLNTLEEDIIRDVLDAGVDLIGGCTNVNGIDKFFNHKLKIKINTYKDSENIIIKSLLEQTNK